MKLQQFAGGLATRLRPQFIGIDEAVEYENIDSRVGTLSPVAGKDNIGVSAEKYFYYYIAKELWLSAAVPTDYLEFDKKIYSSSEGTRPQVFDGTNKFNLGIVEPDQLVDIEVTEHVETLLDISITTVSGSGIPADETYYALVNTEDDKYSLAMQLVMNIDDTGSIVEYAASTVSAPVVLQQTALLRTITIKNATGITIGSTGIDVYRLFQGNYHLIGNLIDDVASVVDDTFAIGGNAILDQDRIGGVQGTVQYAMTYYSSLLATESGASLVSDEVVVEKTGSIFIPSVPASTDPQVDKKRIYRIGGDFTQLTRIAEINNNQLTFTDTTAEIDAEGSLVSDTGGAAPIGLQFLTDSYAMLFGAFENKLFFTPIGEPTSWPVLNFILYEADITGIAATANGLLVMTEFRTHIVTGTAPQALSTQVLSHSQGCISFKSVANVDTAAIWASSDGLCTSDGANVTVITREKLGKIALTPLRAVVHDDVYYLAQESGKMLVFDFGINQEFKQLDLGVETIALANDILYGWSAGALYSLFTASGKETFEYLSPRFVEGRVTELKTYKKVYIYSKGDIIIDIIIDDKIVATKDYSTEDSHVIQVPQEKQRGFFIQFAVRGTGEVYEIEYQVGRRQNA